MGNPPTEAVLDIFVAVLKNDCNDRSGYVHAHPEDLVDATERNCVKDHKFVPLHVTVHAEELHGKVYSQRRERHMK